MLFKIEIDAELCVFHALRAPDTFIITVKP